MKILRYITISLCLGAVLPAYAGWTNWAANNPNGAVRPESRCPEGRSAYGVSLQSQGGYGVVNLRLSCGDSYFGPFIDSPYTTNHRSWYSRGAWLGPAPEYGEYGVARISSISLLEQWGYGMIDVRIGSENYTDVAYGFTHYNRENKLNCPSGSAVKAIQVKEQGGYGIVDFRVDCGKTDQAVGKTAPSAKSAVPWTNTVGVSVDDNALKITKVAGNGWGNSGAASTLFSGNKGVSFTAKDTNAQAFVGFSSVDRSASYNTIEYAIFLSSSGYAYIFESGRYIRSLGSYIASDTFTVKRNENSIQYLKNNDEVYTSTASLNGVNSLLVDTSMYFSNTELTVWLEQ